MSISSEIQRLQNAKADLKTAIESKGVTVSSSAKLDDYADLVDSISTGITPSGTMSISSNGTYDVTNYASADVSVSGGEWTSLGIAQNLEPNGDIVLNSESTYSIGQNAFAYKPIASIVAYKCTSMSSGSQFSGCSSLRKAVFPDLTLLAQSEFFNAAGVSTGSLLCFPSISGGQFNIIGSNNKFTIMDFGQSLPQMHNLTRSQYLKTLILRKTSVVTLTNAGYFNLTPFTSGASGGTGGTIYIPKVLYDQLGTGTNDYQSATNWSTIYGYGNTTFAQIEGSQYEDINWWENY